MSEARRTGRTLLPALAFLLAAGSCLTLDTAWGQAPSGGPAAAAAEWCRTDDPAAFQAARQALRAQDGSGTGAVACPEPRPGVELPPELFLAMPCGHWMAFRKISVPVATILDQYPAAMGSFVEDGNQDLLQQFSHGPWNGVIAGSFSETADGKPASLNYHDLRGRAYYIGKYEVSELQFALLGEGLFDRPEASDPASPVCAAARERSAAASPTAVRPVAGISWYDAVRFTEAFSRWLVAEDRDRIHRGESPMLPWEQGSTGYVRLPTEVEWEFAARGGIAGASEEDRMRTLYRVRDGADGRVRDARLDDIAVVAQTGGTSLVRGIGRKLPNLLGLHDMLGNVEEITLDLFRATRPDTLHGQAGGFVARGGSALTPQAQIGVDHRREVPLFTISGPGSSKLTGFRSAVSAPLFVEGYDPSDRLRSGLHNPEFLDALASARRALVDQAATPGADDRRRALDQVAALRQIEEDKAGISRRLDELQGALERSEVALNEAARQELVEKTKAAVILGTTIRSLGRLSYTILLEREKAQQSLKLLPAKSRERREGEARVAQFDRGWQDMELQIEAQHDFLLATLAALAKRDPAGVDEAVARVKREFGGEQLTIYDAALPHIESALTELRRNGGAISNEIVRRYRPLFDDSWQARARRFDLKL